MAYGDLGRLRRHPGYPLFYVTATLTRFADEMFSVGVVLLVLHRTGSAALAGATVAAVTLPSLVTGPVLGAWLDRAGDRRRQAMILDQVLAATSLVGIVLLAGRGPDWTVPAVALVAGITWPLSFGGFTSLIPVIVPDELLAQANALEATSFNARDHRGARAGGDDLGRLDAGGVAADGGGADPRRDRPDRPRARDGRRAEGHRATDRDDREGGLAPPRPDARAARGQCRRCARTRRPGPADRRVPVPGRRRAGSGSQRRRLHVGSLRSRLDDRSAAARPAPDPLAPGAGDARRDPGAGAGDADLAAGLDRARGAGPDRARRARRRPRPVVAVRRPAALDPVRHAGPDLHHRGQHEGRRVRARSRGRRTGGDRPRRPRDDRAGGIAPDRGRRPRARAGRSRRARHGAARASGERRSRSRRAAL